MKATLSLGSDPEVVVYSKKTGLPVSAVSLLKGENFNYSKETPLKKGRGRTYFHDNANVEGTMPPAKTKKAFVTNVGNYIQDVRSLLGEDFTFVNESYTVFPEQELQSEEAQTFGCSPAFGAFPFKTIERECNEGLKFRTCGGHIHIGRSDFKNPDSDKLIDFESKLKSAQLFEIILGTSLIVIDNDPTSPLRKELYGKAGEHRATDYGIEVRSPGNYWLSSPKTVELVWDLSQICYNIIFQNKEDEIINSVDIDEMVGAINSFDKDKCLEIVEKTGVVPQNIIEKIKEYRGIHFKIHENWL